MREGPARTVQAQDHHRSTFSMQLPPGAASARRAIRVQYYEKDADPRRLA
jgi:hypothetical protein